MKRLLPLFTLLVFSLVTTSAHGLPLGDGHLSESTPQKGWVYSCTTPSGGGGATQDGPWIVADTWLPEKKIAVGGSVLWPNNMFTQQVINGKRLLAGNNLPPHASGTFPILANDPAYQYDQNPNSIYSQSMSYSLPLFPQEASHVSCLPMGTIGVAISGIKIFNALDGEGRDAVAHEIQDSCQGHPERSGAYHYHSMSICLTDNSSKKKHSRALGYALDGFAIYGPRSTGGKVMTNSSLDVCHGHKHRIFWRGKMRKMYHYHATKAYPYTLGCFRGTPVDSADPILPPPPPRP